MEELKHECGVALIRLLKPLSYFQEKYGTWSYGLNKLYLMMEKQHNRGQEGAGLACCKMSTEPGSEYMYRERAEGKDAITEIFAHVHHSIKEAKEQGVTDENLSAMPFAGELYMGHLRYSTTGRSGLSYVHHFLRRNNWRAKNLAICGNFNMTNVDAIFEKLTRHGQHPRILSDTHIMLELMGHRLDREVERVYQEAVEHGLQDRAVTEYIEDHLQMSNVLKTSLGDFDGGFVICGITGSGEMFSMRDPWGIRPAFWYQNDEMVVLASERPVIQTALGCDVQNVHELQAGAALLINKKGETSVRQIVPQKADKACSFERIYFSRGNDSDIYKERIQLGIQLTEPILRAIDNDMQHTVFSFVPNTAEVAFYGMLRGLKQHLNERKIERISRLGHIPTREELEEILNEYVRSDKVTWKDIKLRTFITEDNSRNDLAAHVYDITYGSVAAYQDNLVVIDDSIVRGTTLRESILRILDRLHPRKLVIVSSSPQIRYPDYYGIDMARMEEFCAFRACISLLKRQGKQWLVDKVYRECLEEGKMPLNVMRNCVKDIYREFTAEEISAEIVQMLLPADVKTPVEIVFQSIEGLHRAIPHHRGDWYFTGDYPTPGGMRLVNLAFINYVERIYQFEQKF